MEIRNLNRADLRNENGLRAQRLVPWPLLNAPFEGSWCVVAPGTASTPHTHNEYEIFIAIRGNAVLDHRGGPTPFVTGDVAHFTPGERHSIVNNGNENFEMYSIWWDAEMSGAFTARHHAEGGAA